MEKRFKRGDRVTSNSEAGHVSGRIIKVHTKDTDYKGPTRHATKDEPQYEIKSDKTDHVAMRLTPGLIRMFFLCCCFICLLLIVSAPVGVLIIAITGVVYTTTARSPVANLLMLLSD